MYIYVCLVIIILLSLIYLIVAKGIKNKKRIVLISTIAIILIGFMSVIFIKFSNNEEYTKKALFLATQAREPERHYEHKEIGYNYRMSNICAGIGRGQLKVLDEKISKKKYIYESYKEAFEDIDDIDMMPIYESPNYWLSVMTIKDGSRIKPIDIMEKLEKENIESRPVWKPMHMQPVFEGYKFFSDLDEGSVSEDLFNRGVCLPSDTKMTDEDLNRVIDLVKCCFVKNLNKESITV